jgi:hypothetical protein
MAGNLLLSSFMMHLAILPPVVANARFNYFDILAIIWLIIGLFRGRARGMSQELLPLLQWLGIVVAGGLFYWHLSPLVHQGTQFGILWSNIVAYLLIALGVHLIYLWFKHMLSEKLAAKDVFGRSEFYLGMMAGVTRFGCMLLAGMALMSSHIISAAELANTEKFQAANFSDIRFPTYGQFQHAALIDSFSGDWVQSHLRSVLISPFTVPSQPKSETIAQKSDKMIDEILSKPGSK